jgi:outer membrane receptor protein involved in Fe transport
LGAGFVPLNPDFSLDVNFDPTTIDGIADLRTRNLSSLRTSGWDLSAQYAFQAVGGTMHLALMATRIAELEERVTSTSAPNDTVDTVFHPADWRGRIGIGFDRGNWTSNLFVNHVDGYRDNQVVPAQPVDSYTTVDARIAYEFSPSSAKGVLSGLCLSAFVQNLLDTDPPEISTVGVSSLAFDPTNASPLGRFAGIEISKSW